MWGRGYFFGGLNYKGMVFYDYVIFIGYEGFVCMSLYVFFRGVRF